MVFAWTQEAIAELTQRWTVKGESSGQIAKAMGGKLSRSAVIGKLHRLGIQGNRTVRPEPPKVRLEAARQPPMPYVSKLAEAPGPRSASLLWLPGLGCKFPVGTALPGRADELLFCGEQRERGESYCTRHANICRPGRKLRADGLRIDAEIKLSALQADVERAA